MYLAIFTWRDEDEDEFGSDFKISDSLEEIRKYSLELAKIELEYLPIEDIEEKVDKLGNWNSYNSKVEVHNIMPSKFQESLVRSEEEDSVKCLLVLAKSGKYNCLRLSNLKILQEGINYYTEESVSKIADSLNNKK